jgi:adenylate cyclase
MKTAAFKMFRFEDYTLDLIRGCLRIADQEVELRPKSFEVLRYLVENAGRLVLKDEIIKTVWTDVVVTDESLTRCVSEVRRAIGDVDQKIIKTVQRRGYRFAAPVTWVGKDSGAAPQTAASAGERPPIRLDADQRFEPALLDRPSIAVLPFVNFSGDAQQEYLSDGITEDIITELSRFSELVVIARNSTFQYKGRAVDVREIGQELGVRYVLEGSIRRDGDRLRINAQLIDASTGAHRWAERYDRDLSDVFAVQDEVARTIVAILAAHVKKAETERTLLKPPATWEAYDYYLRGAEAYFLHLTRHTTASLYEARRLLERSLSIDAGYARAYAMLSWTHTHAYLEPFDGDYLNPAALDRAHELAKMAVHLDANLPQAHAQLGWVLQFKRRHEAAIAEFERAFALNHNFIDSRYGHCLVFAGEPAKAIEMLQANMRLDPFQPPFQLGYLGLAYYTLKRYPEAIHELREYASRAPNLRIPHLWLAAAYAQLEQFAEARAEAADVLRIEPSFTIERLKCNTFYKNPADAEHLFDGLRKAGLPED